MTTFDYLLLGILGLSILISVLRGFLREMMSLICWVAGLVLALRYAPTLSDGIASWLSSPVLRYLICFAAIFIAVFIVGFVLSRVLRLGAGLVGLSLLDRCLGGVFGLARGVLLVALTISLVSMTRVEAWPAVSQSTVAPWFQPIVHWLNHHVPHKLQHVSRTLDETNEAASESMPNLKKHTASFLNTSTDFFDKRAD